MARPISVEINLKSNNDFQAYWILRTPRATLTENSMKIDSENIIKNPGIYRAHTTCAVYSVST